MQLNDAISLLNKDPSLFKGRHVWTDLGCGNGTFTIALSHLLDPNSIIHAIDKNKTSLSAIPDASLTISILKHRADFISDVLPVPLLDGVLMANSLHYVKDKNSFIQKLQHHLQPHSCFLIVEYDTEKANPWVPYPLSFASLKQLFIENGFTDVTKLSTRPSVFNRNMLYAAAILK